VWLPDGQHEREGQAEDDWQDDRASEAVLTPDTMPAGLPAGLLVRALCASTHARPCARPPARAHALSPLASRADDHGTAPLQRDTANPHGSARFSRDSGPVGKHRSLAESVLSGRSTAPRAGSGALEGEVLRLERHNVSLMRALAREEECRYVCTRAPPRAWTRAARHDVLLRTGAQLA
jgi:hypothetical protein